MKKSLYHAQLNECSTFLKNIGILKEYNRNQANPKNPGAIFRNLDYEEHWKIVFQNHFYTFIFEDNSMICFENKILNVEDYVCFSYLECPYYSLTYQNYLSDLDFCYEEVGDAFLQEYEQYLYEQGAKEHVTPIRYEYRPDQHNPGIHPASHLHIGYKNDLRLGCGVLFTPVMFVLFILRQLYPALWQGLINAEIAPIIRRECKNLPVVNPCYLHEIDKFEPYLFPH